MAQGTSTQTNQNSGSGGGYFRDVNASLGAFELNPSLSASLGNSTAESESGDISLGSVYSGKTAGVGIGLVKSILIFAGVYFFVKMWRAK